MVQLRPVFPRDCYICTVWDTISLSLVAHRCPSVPVYQRETRPFYLAPWRHVSRQHGMKYFQNPLSNPAMKVCVGVLVIGSRECNKKTSYHSHAAYDWAQ